ncbi:unnamed protein product [Adineta steineri]|uniref:G-protein coupled receptors family 1 profile domain-containing protein n=1 Tax=Adineta steineri TaxID=433720 RepID=A0A818VAM1_9BILA|nr:unnamed protein product [Adineta steineri]CAF3706089.1 unnamed protein product [Adineta steineri]
MTLTLITSIVNICVLCRRTLRSSSCTHYFFASFLGTIVYMFVTPLGGILRLRYNIVFNAFPFGCKTSNFFAYGSQVFITLMLVCASIDRYFVSSSSVRLRNLGKVRVAQRIIIIVSIMTIIFMSPYFYIYDWNYETNQCSLSSMVFAFVYISIRVVLYYIVAPLIMLVFGGLTIYNIRSQANRIAPVGQQNHHRRTEGQLARMLIIQVGVYIVFLLPSGVTYTLITFVPEMNTLFYITIRTITILWQQGAFFFSFFVYILSAKVYRDELKKFFKWDQIHGRIMRNIILITNGHFQANRNIDGVRV